GLVKDTVVVQVLVEYIGVPVTVDVFLVHALAAAAPALEALMRQTTVSVLVLAEVEDTIVIAVLEHVEDSVPVVVFAGIALGGVDKPIVVAIGEENAVVVGVRVQCRDRLGLGREVLDRALQED